MRPVSAVTPRPARHLPSPDYPNISRSIRPWPNHHHVYGAFDNYFVADLKVPDNATQNLAFDFGIDNVFNEQYFLFHPFPGRTYVLAAKYTF